MDSQLKRGLLEYCVLAFLLPEPSYGYEIIKHISPIIHISESTLYPILKRLENQQLVTTYKEEYSGRLRKYYRITAKGEEKLRILYENKPKNGKKSLSSFIIRMKKFFLVTVMSSQDHRSSFFYL